MKKLFVLLGLLLVVGGHRPPLQWGVVSAQQRQGGQNLVITNARLIDGNGGVIPRGSVVVRNGRIASVSTGTASEPGARQIDARGMTVMPGFIDDHRHVIGATFP